MSVIGFDLGNLSCYTACARGGGIETLANEYSSRNTPSFVSFSGKQRLMGTAGRTLRSMLWFDCPCLSDCLGREINVSVREKLTLKSENNKASKCASLDYEFVKECY